MVVNHLFLDLFIGGLLLILFDGGVEDDGAMEIIGGLLSSLEYL
jgi:hypothetical protein